MAPSVSQILAVSYPAVLNEANKPANQFAESALMRELDAKGAIKRKSFGTKLEHTLDYRRNPSTDFLASDLTPLSIAKTEVITALEFDPGQIAVQITWTKADEAKNPSENQKIALVKSLLENAFASHEDAIEQALFTTSTDGFLGLQTIVPDSGQGTVGGVDAAVDTWHRNYVATYASNGSNIEAQMTKAWNNAAKGTGGRAPDIIVSGADAQGIYEGALQALQRFIDTKEADGGYKKMAFKTARYVFSPYGGTRIYFLSSKAFHLNVSKEAYKQKGDVLEIPGQAGYTCQIYSMLQTTTSNKSRNSLLTQV